MAQRMIHYLFGELLFESTGAESRERFMLGSLLPDAFSDIAERDAAHYIVRDGKSAMFDFARFRADFSEYIAGDGLYLGYYMHLIEDAFYREFAAEKQIRRPEEAEGLAFLYNDYHLLNKYITGKYGLSFVLNASADISGEAVNSIARFDVKRLIHETEADFHEEITGETTYITTASVDEFVERYLPPVKEELLAILNGRTTLDPKDYMYIFRR